MYSVIVNLGLRQTYMSEEATVLATHRWNSEIEKHTKCKLFYLVLWLCGFIFYGIIKVEKMLGRSEGIRVK